MGSYHHLDVQDVLNETASTGNLLPVELTITGEKRNSVAAAMLASNSVLVSGFVGVAVLAINVLPPWTD